ncbi:hypothetical protein FOL47_008560 [Perkinsus chesapeaki]|uniref:Uncharacterized protein n=1 Tax=Perkinsus chesapeaki TaxID=330153 RepID=A0A7J6LD97_PERCH|nr:hypothetical protein FOL47_008560 [Perkinsus chesapeaki]
MYVCKLPRLLSVVTVASGSASLLSALPPPLNPQTYVATKAVDKEANDNHLNCFVRVANRDMSLKFRRSDRDFHLISVKYGGSFSGRIETDLLKNRLDQRHVDTHENGDCREQTKVLFQALYIKDKKFRGVVDAAGKLVSMDIVFMYLFNLAEIMPPKPPLEGLETTEEINTRHSDHLRCRTSVVNDSYAGFFFNMSQTGTAFNIEFADCGKGRHSKDFSESLPKIYIGRGAIEHIRSHIERYATLDGICKHLLEYLFDGMYNSDGFGLSCYMYRNKSRQRSTGGLLVDYICDDLGGYNAARID